MGLATPRQRGAVGAGLSEVASTLKLNQQTARNMIDADKLPALHTANRIRIRR